MPVCELDRFGSAASFCETVFAAHGSTLRRKLWVLKPRMEYHVLADAVFWTDEYPLASNFDVENAFRLILNHRTSLLTDEEGRFPDAWRIARKYFPQWIGFRQKRCTYDKETSHRITRIRRVSKWRINKFFAETED